MLTSLPKTVLISGGTKGIGRGAVIELLTQGYNIATFSRNSINCELLKEELPTLDSKKYLLSTFDVTNENAINDFVQKTNKKFGTIDILINNAGIGYFRDSDKFDQNKFSEMLKTNIMGPALLSKAVIPIMKHQKSGLIINLASISGKKAFSNGEFYSATKFAVMGYSEGLRNELKDFGIKVCTVCPGMIKTDFFDKEELERRMKIWNGQKPTMLEVTDVVKVLSLICNQSTHCDIQDITLMPF